jgi:hypothetical protein
MNRELMLTIFVGSAGLLVLFVLFTLLRAWLFPPKPSSLETALHPAIPLPQHSEDLSGALKDFPLHDLLQFLAQSARSGILKVVSGRRRGTIQLIEGMIVHAEFRRMDDLPALYALLYLDCGDFVFHAQPPGNQHVRGREVIDVLMLWMENKDNGK